MSTHAPQQSSMRKLMFDVVQVAPVRPESGSILVRIRKALQAAGRPRAEWLTFHVDEDPDLVLAVPFSGDTEDASKEYLRSIYSDVNGLGDRVSLPGAVLGRHLGIARDAVGDDLDANPHLAIWAARDEGVIAFSRPQREDVMISEALEQRLDQTATE